ncbi:hypothetical protein [Bradyrhizobium sp. AUGA SZCCT0431]|uniref:hypothetical protein n=1 Tax=Bradyrhizobium sp. AUGA SZCCT0431 TaxID=2807674 RepID=UPI00201348E7|nr:hypothetical protein [Bradyrhizobium sp. AUGA SZCCT0431]
MAFVARVETSRVTRKSLSHPMTLDITNPDALKRKGIIALDVVDEEAAIELARKIADATGRSVTVKDADMIEIQTIPATTKQ